MGLDEIRARIRAAEEAAARPPGATRLIAVSKQQPRERVAAVLEAGHRLFGENRVQEAAERWPPFRAAHPDIELHLVGPLQSNKAREAVAMFDAIHSVDRLRLARRLADLAQERGASPGLFIQVNTGEEAQKSGVAPDATDELVAECRRMDLPVVGLMCLPPADEEPALHFALLAKIAARNGLDGLSMGMSADFERAVAQGATHLRIGASIFGSRDPR